MGDNQVGNIVNIMEFKVEFDQIFPHPADQIAARHLQMVGMKCPNHIADGNRQTGHRFGLKIYPDCPVTFTAKLDLTDTGNRFEPFFDNYSGILVKLLQGSISRQT